MSGATTVLYRVSELVKELVLEGSIPSHSLAGLAMWSAHVQQDGTVVRPKQAITGAHLVRG